MALSFDDRLLGEKVHNYCSSSEGEDDSDDEGCGGDDIEGVGDGGSRGGPPPTMGGEEEAEEEDPIPRGYTTAPGQCLNTGPKGVVQDWRRFKQLEIEKREEQEREKSSLAKKLTLTCRPYKDDVKEKQQEEELNEMFDGMAELDDFLQEYREKRLAELRQRFIDLPRFGKVYALTAESFVYEIDKESPRVTVLIHIFELNNRACDAVNGCFNCLATEYPTVKFCRLRASDAKMSKKFTRDGVPAILVYKEGQLIGNLVRINKDLGEDFYAVDLESYLLEHGFLPDQTADPSLKLGVASSIRSAAITQDSDSDYDVD